MSLRPFFVRSPERGLKGAFMRRSGSGADNGVVNACARPHSLPRRGPAALRALAAALLLGTLLAPAGAGDDDRRDHERARAAVQAGEVLPLPALLQRLQRTHPGQVLELELEHEDGRWIYEIKLLQPGGQLLKLEVDAATAQVLQSRPRPAEPPRTAGAPPR